MAKYKLNKDQEKDQMPSDEEIQKHKDVKRLRHDYDKVVKRSKKPLYKDPKMFFLLIMIVAIAWIIGEEYPADKDAEKKDEKDTPADTTAVPPNSQP